MKKNSIEDGRFTANGKGLGTVTREMVLQRAHDIAEINGRVGHVIDADFQQAHRELTGEELLEPRQTAAEQLPEEKRWQAIPESEGKRAPEVPAADDQTIEEKLVEEGVEEAEHDQMTQATRASARRDMEE
jgi:hypothetical protein